MFFNGKTQKKKNLSTFKCTFYTFKCNIYRGLIIIKSPPSLPHQDDIIYSPHSFIDACKHLKICEASRVVILACHGILSEDAAKEIQESTAIDEIIVTNTYPVPQEKLDACPKLKIMDISGVLAEAIRRTHNGESISYLFHTPM